jgi:uncharacterized protein YqjF (DUF2071 family)
MNPLKKIPISFKGELHDIQLINFSVNLEEVVDKIPIELKIRNYNQRALISMVNVDLKKMHPRSVHPAFSFNYRHVAFRLLLNDGQHNNGEQKGIYFLRSFSEKPLVVVGGKLMTNYNLEQAKIYANNNMFELRKGKEYVHYALTDEPPVDKEEPLFETIQKLDRAYSKIGSQIKVTKVIREKWPIRWVNCYHFETNFFETAELEGAFKIDETIYYQWQAPQTVRNSA